MRTDEQRQCLQRLNNTVTHSPIKVLIVDDSLFMRTLISDLLRGDPQISVAATASSGHEAIRKIASVRPDCVLLDLVMPDLDGLTTLKIIMAVSPLPVIILSAYCQEQTEWADRCKCAGAVCLIPKPSGELSLDIALIRHRILAEVKRAVQRSASTEPPLGCLDKRVLRKRSCAYKLIVIGASTGGQSIVEAILKRLPTARLSPLLIVQHAPTDAITRSFAERMARTCMLPVKIAHNGETPHAGVVYVAPGGSFVSVENDERSNNRSYSFRTATDSTSACFQVRSADGVTLTPSIDRALHSAAITYGSKVMAIILSGLGNDGLAGMRTIKAMKGKTIVQDHSATILQMPSAVITEGLADHVMDTDQIAGEIARSTS